ALGKVTVREAVAWSADREKYFTLMKELAAIEKQLTPPAQRTSARLISALPPQVAVYMGLPNLGPTMEQAVTLIEQRTRENSTLHEWWNSPGSADLKALAAKMQQVTPLLGEEIAFALVKPQMPLVMAEVKPGKEAELEAQLKIVLPKEAALRFHNGLALISKSSAALDAIAPGMGQGAATPFGKELAARYARGVKWILGADLETIGLPAEANRVMGQTPPRYAFLEQRTVEGNEENEATVLFAGPRTGVAAWLAEPGSAGSAEYASADAVAVVSAATRNPRQIMEELEKMVPSFAGKLDEIEREAGVNVRNDIASALGTDFTVSVETAAVPIPGWFAAVEVYQPTTLNTALTRFAEAYNREAGSERKLAMTQETIEGRQWNSLTMSGVGLHWTFDRGYWIVAMDRAVAMRAIATRSGGFPLVRSSRFKAEMPTLAGLHPSGFVWFHTGPAAEALAQSATSPELKRVLASSEPSLTTINGETERIQIASRRRLTSFLMDTMLLAGGKKNDERSH
ncbi:MAG TPA: hypothetical protein VFQ91_29070, partial [Bryobacteraceae bacterium]|nr:hypothetical protein [Bryobacteraceae bacterium]